MGVFCDVFEVWLINHIYFCYVCYKRKWFCWNELLLWLIRRCTICFQCVILVIVTLIFILFSTFRCFYSKHSIRCHKLSLMRNSITHKLCMHVRSSNIKLKSQRGGGKWHEEILKYIINNKLPLLVCWFWCFRYSSNEADNYAKNITKYI